MIVIELVDESGQLLARRPADAVPCTIGSARDNTIVIEGEDVAPYHARIDANADGTLSVTALGIHPGLHRPGAPERQPSLVLTLTAPVAIGRGVLRLLDTATVAAPAPAGVREAPAAPTGWRAWVARRQVQYAVAITSFVAAAGWSWFTLPSKDRGTVALGVGIAFLAFVALWAGFWALVDRARHGARRFGSHFAVAGIGTILSLVVTELTSWQQFFSPGSTVAASALLLVSAVMSGLVLYAQIRVMGPGNREKHMRWAVGLTAGLFLITTLMGRLDDDWSNEATFTGILKPWPAAATPARPLEAYDETLVKMEKSLEEDGDS